MKTSHPSTSAQEQALPCRSEAEQFLAALSFDPSTSAFTFQTFDERREAPPVPGRKDGRLVRIRHGALAQHWRELARLNHLGAGIFVTVNVTDLKGRSTGNVIAVRALFVDLDGAPLDPVAICNPPPHIIVESSPGRWHCYWLVTGLPLDQFEPLQKALAARFGGDGSVHDLPRVMRLPGFAHRKGTPFLSLLQDVDPRPPYTFEQLRAAFQPSQPPVSAAPRLSISARAVAIRPGDLRPTLHRVHGLLRTMAAAEADRNRNKLLFWCGCRVRDMCRAGELDLPAGMQVIEALRRIATQTGLTQREIETTLASAMRSS